MWKYYALLSAIFAALTAILAKVGVKDINGNLATAVRTSVVLFLAWGIVFFSGHLKDVKELSKVNLVFLILSGLATGLSWIFYFKALETGDVSKVAPIDKLSIVFVMILAFIFLKEPIDIKTIAGGTLILAGTIVLIW
ncbi:MAG: EamA family transporter [Dysgonomonas sp.]|jgi:transporter family protein|uniref:EamA family transporter n=1 Tax=unclassified Dysgonomonas TaxID=2630389 RepID=UPI0025BE4B66|nr:MULTISPECIES: EamA family transporter [unclassified Dysgonomonas]MDR1717602.1 EamA family transporter [Prevotella sp.]MDR2003696.1 EamA family transporter [Prevotella sp.]HMM01564.1 EamA family transporter [Dysgonomonas sp.]